ncbi:Uncharacterised protein [Bordetella pertussis]|nr:Uncharacterised protein [Bordetella pertussis]CFP66005.1 Uncharacterised protein [Bordetella pertussis]
MPTGNTRNSASKAASAGPAGRRKVPVEVMKIPDVNGRGPGCGARAARPAARRRRLDVKIQ